MGIERIYLKPGMAIIDGTVLIAKVAICTAALELIIGVKCAWQNSINLMCRVNAALGFHRLRIFQIAGPLSRAQ